MKRILSWSLLKRLLPVLLIPVLLFSSIEVLPVVAGEAEPGVEAGGGQNEPGDNPDNSGDDKSGEEGENTSSGDDISLPQNDEGNQGGQPVNNEGGDQNGQQGEQPADGDDQGGKPVNNEGQPGNAGDGAILDENGQPINPDGTGNGVQVDENGQPIAPNGAGVPFSALGMNRGFGATNVQNEETSITINFNISGVEGSELEINNGSIDPQGGKYVISEDAIEFEEKDDGTKVGHTKDSITFNYHTKEWYALDNISGGDFTLDKDAHTITCNFEDIEEDKQVEFTITGSVVKTDTEGPEITDVTVAESGEEPASSYNAGSLGEIKISRESSKLAVSGKVTDEVSGVNSVAIVYEHGNAEETVNLDVDEEGKFTWEPRDIGNYKLIRIEAKDNADTERIYNLEGKRLCKYEDNEEDGLNLSISDDKWHSVALNGPVKIEIKGTTNRKITKIIITDSKGNVVSESTNIADNFNGKAFDINQSIDLGITQEDEGEITYKASVEFGGDTEEHAIDGKTVTAKIDNKAPTKRPSFNTEEYQEGFLFWAKDKIDVEIMVPCDCDGTGAVSGFNKIKYSINDGTGEVFYEKTIDQRNFLKSNSDYYVFTDTLEGSGEKIFRVTVYSISDLAGNSTTETIYQDFGLDSEGPDIAFSYNDIKKEVDEYSFFKGELTGTVTISDISLKPETVKVEGHEVGIEEISSKLKFEVIKNASEPVYNNGFLSPKKTAIQNFSATEDGEYYILASAEDEINGNAELTPRRSRTMVLDNKEPEISISYDKDDSSEGGDSFYNSSVGVTVTVSDKWLDESASKVTIQKTDQNGAQITYGPFTDFSGELGDMEHTYSFTTDGDGEYKVIVEAVDMSGNHSQKEGAKFTVDATLPEVTIAFDKNDPMNGKYYNETRTATVTVTDFTFTEELAGLKVEEKYGSADIGGWSQTGAFTYTCTVTFEKDGQYELSCQSEDKAHNQSEKKSEPEFVIDKTAPEIQVNYNSAEASNGNFYKDTRIASVNIKEISFDDKLVEITAQPLNEGGTLPAVGGFSSSDDQNIASITFDEDGTYGYVVNCTDLAGNKAENYISDVFIIDKTAPEVTFSGVENYSANNAEVAPTVKYGDKYIDIDASSVTLRGSNNGIVTVGNSISQTEDGFVVSYSDFAHDKSMDDLYIMEAKVRDKAGNESNEQLIFSVNRHGSVFVVGDLTKALNDKYYTNEPKDVKVTEINIDTITKKDVSYTRDGDLTKLKNGDGYGVKQQGDDTSWKTYEYTVYNKNFKRDGRYSVSIYTEDKATNIQDNKSRDAEVTFAVDMTAPSIVTAGIKENEVYKETSHSFNYDVSDNMAIDKFVVYVDGKAVKTYDQDSIEKGEDMSLTLPESDDAYTITMIAEDLAGNREISVISGVLVSTKTDVKSPDPNDGLGHNNTSGNSPFVMQRVLFIILAGASVVSVGGAGVLLYRRKIK